MLYLYRPAPDVNNGQPWQSDLLPTCHELQLVIDGELEIFKVNPGDGRFEQLIPIDDQDTDSWNEIPFTQVVNHGGDDPNDR